MNVKSFADLNDIIINEDDIAQAGDDYYDDFEGDEEEGSGGEEAQSPHSSASEDSRRYDHALSAAKTYRYDASPIQGDREDRFLTVDGPQDGGPQAEPVSQAGMEGSVADDAEESRGSDAFWEAAKRADTPSNEEVLREIGGRQSSNDFQRRVAHVAPKNINTVLPGRPLSAAAASRFSAVTVVQRRDSVPGLQQKESRGRPAFSAKENLDKNCVGNDNLYSIIQGLVDAASRKALEREERERQVGRLLVDAVPVRGVPRIGTRDEPFKMKVGAGALDVDEADFARYKKVSEIEVGDRIDDMINKERKGLMRGAESSSEDGRDDAYATTSVSRRARGSNEEEEEDTLRALEDRRAAALERLGMDRKKLADMSESVYASFLADVINVCRERSRSSKSVQEMAMHKVLAQHIAEAFTGDVISAIREQMFDAGLDALVRTSSR